MARDHLKTSQEDRSKESILDIFLQIGISESPCGSIPPVNKRLKSRVHQRSDSELPSDEVTENIQNEELRNVSRPLGLMDLPFEVCEKIIITLDCIARLEAKEICNKKHERKVTITGLGDQTPYKTYIPLDSPILNSIQNFSITSRKIYQCCQPWLWRNLRFPTSLPAPMALWTEDILLRQGSHVKSLWINFSPMGGGGPDEHGDNDPFHDNLELDFESEYIESLSSKNIKLLINRCPNLSTLTIEYDYKRYDEGRTEAFFLELVSLLSSLKQFRHLHVLGDPIKFMNKFPSQAVASLPLLESLTCGGVTVSRHRKELGEESFGSSLSKLRYLSQLHLYRFEDIDESWCLHDWPRTITDLTFRQCDTLSLNTAYQIIRHIAPHLTRLELDYKKDNSPWGSDHSWNPRLSLILPSLIDLKLSSQNPNLLLNFRDCKSLRSLQWTYRTMEHLQSLNEILSQAPWPQLKKLDVAPCHRLYSTRVPMLQAQLRKVVKYCEQANMKANVHTSYLPSTKSISDYDTDEDDSDEDE